MTVQATVFFLPAPPAAASSDANSAAIRHRSSSRRALFAPGGSSPPAAGGGGATVRPGATITPLTPPVSPSLELVGALSAASASAQRSAAALLQMYGGAATSGRDTAAAAFFADDAGTPGGESLAASAALAGAGFANATQEEAEAAANATAVARAIGVGAVLLRAANASAGAAADAVAGADGSVAELQLLLSELNAVVADGGSGDDYDQQPSAAAGPAGGSSSASRKKAAARKSAAQRAIEACTRRTDGAVDIRFAFVDTAVVGSAAALRPPPPPPGATVQPVPKPPPPPPPSSAKAKAALPAPPLKHTGGVRRPVMANQVMGGIMLHQTRATGWSPCTRRFFGYTSPTCGERGSLRLTTQPFGADPAFFVTSPGYVPGLNRTLFYGPHEVNPRTDLPYGFFPVDLPGYPPGFPVFLGVDLTGETAFRVSGYLSDAVFLDPDTLSVSVEMLTYNADSRGLLLTSVQIDFSDPMAIEATSGTLPVPLLFSGSGGDDTSGRRLAAACGMNAAMTALAVLQLRLALFGARRVLGAKARRRRASARRRGGRAAADAGDPFPGGGPGAPSASEVLWLLVEWVHAGAQVAAAVVFWAGLLVSALSVHALEPPFDVYESPEAQARPLLLRRVPLWQHGNATARAGGAVLAQAASSSPAVVSAPPPAASLVRSAPGASVAVSVASVLADSSLSASLTAPADLLWATDGKAGVIPLPWQRAEDSTGLRRVALAFRSAENAAKLSQARPRGGFFCVVGLHDKAPLVLRVTLPPR